MLGGGGEEPVFLHAAAWACVRKVERQAGRRGHAKWGLFHCPHCSTCPTFLFRKCFYEEESSSSIKAWKQTTNMSSPSTSHWSLDDMKLEADVIADHYNMFTCLCFCMFKGEGVRKFILSHSKPSPPLSPPEDDRVICPLFKVGGAHVGVLGKLQKWGSFGKVLGTMFTKYVKMLFVWPVTKNVCKKHHAA